MGNASLIEFRKSLNLKQNEIPLTCQKIYDIVKAQILHLTQQSTGHLQIHRQHRKEI